MSEETNENNVQDLNLPLTETARKYFLKCQ
jgi:hypothetical protein